MVKSLFSKQETQVQSLGQEDAWRRKWQPIPLFLPGKLHRQRSLAGYSIWGSKELDTTERLTLSLSVGQITSPLWASEVQSNAITFIYS